MYSLEFFEMLKKMLKQGTNDNYNLAYILFIDYPCFLRTLNTAQLMNNYWIKFQYRVILPLFILYYLYDVANPYESDADDQASLANPHNIKSPEYKHSRSIFSHFYRNALLLVGSQIVLGLFFWMFLKQLLRISNKSSAHKTDIIENSHELMRIHFPQIFTNPDPNTLHTCYTIMVLNSLKRENALPNVENFDDIKLNNHQMETILKTLALLVSKAKAPLDDCYDKFVRIDAHVNAISIDGSETLLLSHEKAQLIKSFKAVTSFLAGDTKEIDPTIFTKYRLAAVMVSSNKDYFNKGMKSFQPPVNTISLFNPEVTGRGEDIETVSRTGLIKRKGTGVGAASKTIEVVVE